MKVYYQEQYQVQQLRTGLEIFVRVQVPNDPVDSQQATKFEQALELRTDVIFVLVLVFGEVLDGQACNQVNYERALDILLCYQFCIVHLFSQIIDESRAEANQDVEGEDHINDDLNILERRCAKRLGLKRYIQRNLEAAKDDTDDHKDIPSLFVLLRARYHPVVV